MKDLQIDGLIAVGSDDIDEIRIDNLTILKGEKIGIYDRSGDISRQGIYSEVLFKAVSGINDYQGSIKLFGKEVRKKKKSILQYMGIYFDGTIYHSIKLSKFMKIMGSYYRGVTAPRIEDIMRKFSLNSRKGMKLKNIDIFNQKKIGLASASLNNPEIYIFHNILSGLDDEAKAILADIIKKETEGRTLIMNSNILGELISICDIVYELDQGELNVVHWNKK